MARLKLLVGFHCHQPVDNFEHVFEQAYDGAYRPLVETLAGHPRLKFALHFSGVLFDWFLARRPEFIEELQKLVKRGQVELLSSGYYEPILSLIPDEDKLGQITMANEFIKEKFWLAPRGLWLTERVWEPSLPKVLAKAGIEYTLVDEDHFLLAGAEANELNGYYLTEDEGEVVRIFPISRQLRELVPFRPVEEVVQFLRGRHQQGGSLVYFDDGEKFGLRPDAHRFNFQEKNLEKLLARLESSADWLEFSSFSDYLEEEPARGRIYLPTTSYNEMTGWSRPAENSSQGQGYFRNFLVKYPETNNLHKKMLQLSGKIRSLAQGKTIFGATCGAAELEQARRELYQGQFSCAYWHGDSGGLQLNHLRHSAYTHLIRAERELDRLAHGGKPFVELTLTDLNKDGEDEVILANDLLSLYFSPAEGGALYELDYKPKAFNLVNTLARGGDRHPRACLVDHFLAAWSDLDDFRDSAYGEVGDFAAGRYSVMPRRREGEVSLCLSREGLVEGNPVKVEKNFALLAGQSICAIEYEITNLGNEPDEFWFVPEFNFSLLAAEAEDRYLQIDQRELADRSPAAVSEELAVSRVKLVDEWNGFNVSLDLDRPAQLWRFPVETETGRVRHYQSTALLPGWKFKLGPRESWRTKLVVRIEQ